MVIILAIILWPSVGSAMEEWQYRRQIEEFKRLEQQKTDHLRGIEQQLTQITLKQQKGCSGDRLSTFNQIANRNGVEQTRQNQELEKLRVQVEKAKLENQLTLLKLQNAPSSAQRKATATQKSEHDRQKKQVKDKLDNLSKLIQQLASGGSQEKRQANFDKTMIAYLDAMQTYQKFYDEWTVPKYTK